MKRKTHKEFIDEIKIVNPDIDIIGRYENSKNILMLDVKDVVQSIVLLLTICYVEKNAGLVQIKIMVYQR